MSSIAEALKERGNALFKAGDYNEAEEQYTLAIQKQSDNPIYFTNRAFTRIKLQKWEGVVNDCLHSLENSGQNQNFKAFFYLAQAQLALHHPHEALTASLTAYEQAMYTTDVTKPVGAASIASTVALVIKCRKAKFESRQLLSQSRRGTLLSELCNTIEEQKRLELADIEAALSSGEKGPVEAAEQRAEVLEMAEKKTEDIKNVFAAADPENHAKREVPDWAIDTITFELIHDPVVTKNGHSYERSTLVEHLKRTPTDPLTREVLTVDELRPNVSLKKALDEFWEKAEGWAMEW